MPKLDELEAREKQLSDEVERAAAERDRVGRMLAEARGEPLPAPPRPPSKWPLVAIALATIAGSIFLLGRRPIVAKLECGDAYLEKRHHEVEQASVDNYRAALRAGKLEPITFEAVNLDVPAPGEPLIDSSLIPIDGTVVEIEYRGRKRRAVALTQSGSRAIDFVRDAGGNIRVVKRAPSFVTVESFRVEECQWGCWSGPPSPMPTFDDRMLYFLDDGQTFGGEVVVAYEHPILDVEYTQMCPVPPSSGPPTALSPMTDCETLRPTHERLQRIAGESFADAMNAKGLQWADLKTIRFGGEGMYLPELTYQGRAAEPFEVITYKTKRVLVGSAVEYPYSSRGDELVRDKAGDVWRVKRVPKSRVVGRPLRVEACAWGCFGSPPPGAISPPHRVLYILDGKTQYRGEIELPYDAPQLQLETIQRDCPLPG